MLRIEELTTSYGGVDALHAVSLTVEAGQLVTIVGPNGAGKTTLLKSISGTVSPRAGRITFLGQDLLAISPPRRAHLEVGVPG